MLAEDLPSGQARLQPRSVSILRMKILSDPLFWMEQFSGRGCFKPKSHSHTARNGMSCLEVVSRKHM